MTGTEIEQAFKNYLQNLDKNYFKCDKKGREECVHKTHLIHMMRKAFWAGYAEGQYDPTVK